MNPPASGSPLSPDPRPVVFSFRGGRAALVAEVAADLSPDEFLYGLPTVREVFPNAQAVEPNDVPGWLKALLRPLEKATARLGYPLFFAAPLGHWRQLRAARALVGTTDSTGIPLLLLKRLGLLPGTVILITQGLHSAERDFAHLPWSGWLKKQLGACVARAASLVTLGEGDSRAVRQAFEATGLPEVVILHFGIDHRFWRPSVSGPVEDYVLSVGSDRMRDYPTLLRGIGETPLRIVTRMALPRELIGPGVRVESDLSWAQLREIYQRARFVVTPVLDQPRDSGHSATLQAMACGKAVILSDTAGLWDREQMRHGETCYLVRPGDPEAMREAIEYFWAHPEEAARIGRNARLLVETRATSDQFGRDLAEVIGRWAV